MYMYLQRPFGYGAHFTGVETGIHLLYRVIIRSNMRTSAMMVHWVGGGAYDTAEMVFSDHDDPGIPEIEIPSSYLEFDREVHADIP